METRTNTHGCECTRQDAITDPFTGDARWICRDCGDDHTGRANCHCGQDHTASAEGSARFQVGGTYTARSSCDYDTIFEWTVVRRTAKFITVTDRFGETNRVGVKMDERGEWAMPFGRYSMAPVIHA